MRPQVQSAEMESDYVVAMANPSGVDVSLFFSADDPEMACDYTFLPDRRYISATGTSSTRLRVKARAPYRGAGQKQIVFTVKATRQGELLPTSTVQGSFNQLPGRPIALELIPPQQSQPGSAKYSVRVHNPFNGPIQVWLEARDEADALAFTITPQRFQILAGGDGLIEVRVTPKDKLLPTDQRRVQMQRLPGLPGLLAVAREAPGDELRLAVHGRRHPVHRADEGARRPADHAAPEPAPVDVLVHDFAPPGE